MRRALRSAALFALCLVATLIACGPRASLAQVANPPAARRAPLRVWLMPSEPAVEPKLGEDPLDIDDQIDEFNQKYCDEWLVVENTMDSKIRAEMVALNRQYVLRNWPVVAGQVQTISALRRFAQQNNQPIIVRYLHWDRAFADIRSALESDAADKPHVCQIGTTWRAYFAQHGLLARPTPEQARRDGGGKELVWARQQDESPTTLRFLYDLRLVYYWRRLPSEPATAPQQELNTESWESMIASLKQREPGPCMVLPTLLETNLLHDYAPLVWSGDAEILQDGKFNLTREGALQLPQLLCRTMRERDAAQQPPLFAFPEMSHYEAMQLFVLGEYVAIVEPVGFLQYLHARFTERFPGKSLWDHLGVGIPRATFRGGSDLMVAASDNEAFRLARFLGTDPTLQNHLAELGHMPVQLPGQGLDAMLHKLDAPTAFRNDIKAEVDVALHQGGSREYPEHPAWALEVESLDTLEAFQHLWRRVAVGAAEDRVIAAAANAEETVNRKLLRNRYWWSDNGWHFALPLVMVGVVAGIAVGVVRHRGLSRENAVLAQNKAALEREAKALRENSRALRENAALKGGLSAAWHMVDAAHWDFKILLNEFEGLKSADVPKVQKANMVLAGLRGWRRGLNKQQWLPRSIEPVVWQAVLLALDSIRFARLFAKWERETGVLDDREVASSIRAFLEQEHILRTTPEMGHEAAPAYFEVTCDPAIQVSAPFLFEQLLVCLVQNGLKASKESRQDGYPPLRIETQVQSSRAKVVVTNRGRLSPELAQAINAAGTIDDFERSILRLYDSSDERSWPGIGLIEAVCLAKQFYGGLSVACDEQTVSFTISLDRAP